MTKEIYKTTVKDRITIKEAAFQMGYSYHYFLDIYTDFCVRHNIKIYSIPGRRKKWIDQKDLNRCFQAFAIN